MRTFSKKYYLVVFSFFIFISIIGAFIIIYVNHQNDIQILDYQFDGLVDSISYNIQGEPFIIINDNGYALSARHWYFDDRKIQKGDSMIKNKNSMMIKLFKRDGEIIIRGNDY